MTNLNSILNSREITLLTKVCRVKAMFFPVVMYGCESWTIKMAVKVKGTQSCPTLCDPMDYTVHGILQARILEWVAFSAEHQRIDAFKLRCWRRLLRAPCTARRSNQSILKEINSEYSLEGLMLKQKLQIIWPPDVKSQLNGKDPDAGKVEGRRRGNRG